MAVVSSGFVLIRSPDIAFISDGPLPDTIIFTNETHNRVNIYNLSDRHPTRDWSVKGGHALISPVVALDGQQCGSLDRTTVRIWDNNDQSRDTKLSRPAHSLVSAARSGRGDNGRVDFVLYTNGSIGLVPDPTETWGGRADCVSVAWSDTIRSDAEEGEEAVMWIVAVLDTKVKGQQICFSYKVSLGAHFDVQVCESSLPTPMTAGDVKTAYCLHQTEDEQICLLALDVARGFTRVPLTRSDVSEANEQKTFVAPPGIVAHRISMTSLDSTQIAIAGLLSKDQVGVGIWDCKYGVLHSFTPLPSSSSSSSLSLDKQNVWNLRRHGKHLLLHTQSGVDIFPLLHRRSTLSACMNKLPPKVLGTNADSVASILTRLADEKQTHSLTEFRRTFLHLSDWLTDCATSVADTSLLVLPLIDAVILRCANSTVATTCTWWPIEELRALISAKLVSRSVCKPLVEALLRQHDLHSLYLFVKYTAEIPASSIVLCLGAFLRASDEAAHAAMTCGPDAPPEGMETDGGGDQEHDQSGDDEEDDVSTDGSHSCPFGKSKAKIIDILLRQRYNQVALVKSLKTLELDLVLALLKYIHYLLTRTYYCGGGGSRIGGETVRPSEDQKLPSLLPSWLCVVQWLKSVNDSQGANVSFVNGGREIVEALQLVTESQYIELLAQRKANILEDILFNVERRAKLQRTGGKVVSAGDYCILPNPRTMRK